MRKYYYVFLFFILFIFRLDGYESHAQTIPPIQERIFIPIFSADPSEFIESNNMTTPAYTWVPAQSGNFNTNVSFRNFSAFWTTTGGLPNNTTVLTLNGATTLTIYVKNGYYEISGERSMLKVPVTAHKAGLVSGQDGVTFYVNNQSYKFGNNGFALAADSSTNNVNLTVGLSALAVYTAQVSATEAGQFVNATYGSYQNIVFDGNSLTYDSSSLSYPSQTLGLWARPTKAFSIAIGGQNTTDMLNRQPSYLYPLFASSAAENIVFVWEGTNQLGADACNALAAYLKLVQYANNARAHGWKVVIVTVLPQHAFSTGCFEAARQSLNTMIHNTYTTFADALMDIGADTTIGQPGAWSNAQYYRVGEIHLTEAGNQIVAELAAATLFNLSVGDTLTIGVNMSLAQYSNAGCPEQFPDGTLGQVIIQGGVGPQWSGPVGIVIADAGNYFSTDNVEAALQQLAAGQTCAAIQNCNASAPASVCTPPSKVIGLDGAGTTRRYDFLSEIAPDPSFTEFALPNYYVAGGAVPANGTTTTGVVSGTLIATNSSCRFRYVRFSWQAWAFFNFIHPNAGAYQVYVQVNAGGYAEDHGVGVKVDSTGAAESISHSAKSILERSFILAPGATVTVDVRVDFDRTGYSVAAPASYIDTGYASTRFSLTMI